MTKKCAVLWAALVVQGIVGCGDDVKIIEIEPTKIEFRNLGDSTELKIKALNSKGVVVRDTPVFAFSAENPSVADVSADGTVKATGNGDTAIFAKTPEGITGEAFVSVCLPKELVCDPMDQLDIRVGTGAPVKCHVLDCHEQLIAEPKIDFSVLAANIAKADKAVMSGQRGIMSLPLTGEMIGDTEVKVTAYNYEKTVRVHVDAAIPIPGEAEYTAKQGGGGKKGGGGDSKYTGAKTGFDHILNNLKF
jgi:hypothetical protein